METPTTAIRDFLTAVDRGYLGPMPAGFNDSAFVKALREQAGRDDALAAEREACARLAETLVGDERDAPGRTECATRRGIAAAIRARST
jgi:hypothetical protein